MQLVYSQNMDAGFAGMRVDLSNDNVDAYAAEGVVVIGTGVVAGTSAAKQVKKPAGAGVFRGIALAQAMEQSLTGAVEYADKATVPVLTDGRGWVTVKGAVAIDGDVYLIHTGADAGKFAAAAGGTPAGVAAAGASAAFAGNTGDGAITAAPATGAGCKAGTYKAVCIEPAAEGGKFVVEDPDGVIIGVAAVGVEFATHVTFTIADGAADFVAGDGFNITVAAVAAVPVAQLVPGAKFKTATAGDGIAVIEL